jgi:hypothetical protein
VVVVVVGGGRACGSDAMDDKKRRFEETWRFLCAFRGGEAFWENRRRGRASVAEPPANGKRPSETRVCFRVISLDGGFGKTRAKTKGKIVSSSRSTPRAFRIFSVDASDKFVVNCRQFGYLIDCLCT